MSETIDRVIIEATLPTDILMLYKLGFMSTEEMTKKLEDFIENHDHKEVCNCGAVRSLIKAFREIE